MSISLFVSLIIILVSAPLLTHQLFSGSFERQKNKIALDNAAILLGRRDRSTFNFIARSNRVADFLETIHHPIHLAARSGLGSTQLMAQDLSLESAIRELHFSSQQFAKANWTGSLISANAEMHRLGSWLAQQRRSLVAPLIGKRCPVCHLEAYWIVDSSQTDSYLRAQSGSLVTWLWIRMSQTQSNWNYHLSLR